MPLTNELYEKYKAQKLVGGGLYMCDVCRRKFSGGRHFISVQGMTHWICLNCWPGMLEDMETMSRSPLNAPQPVS